MVGSQQISIQLRWILKFLRVHKTKMEDTNANIVICGAGIAGLTAAYYLSSHGFDGILLVDKGAPLSLTSDKSTEAYRNWWPGLDGAMLALMNRSIDLLERLAIDNNNVFHLNRRGYAYVTANPEQISEFKLTAERAADQGAGPIRVHKGLANDPPYSPHHASNFIDQPDGCDLILDPLLIQEHFPYLSEGAIAVLHTRRCGWFSAHQLGMLLLEKATQQGVSFINAHVEGITLANNAVDQIHIRHNGALSTVSTSVFINAAGPHALKICEMMEVSAPIFCEKHLKVSIKDIENAVARDAPLLIWNDPQLIAWDEDERQMLSESDADRILLEELPSGAHLRPEGGIESQNILMLWPYHLEPVQPTFPVTLPLSYPEVVLRGLVAMVPGLQPYLERMPRPFIDGGYYTKTPENRLLAGPLPVKGAYILGALSGYGLMAACAAAELLAAHIAQTELPWYAPAFMLSRYDDPNYLRTFEEWEHSDQL